MAGSLFRCFANTMARSVALINCAIVCALILPTIWADPIKLRNIERIKRANPQYRLPNNTRPESYEIFLTTEIADGIFEFTGVVQIDVNVVEESNSITLHHRQLEITSTQLLAGEKEISLAPVNYDSVSEFLTLTTVNHKFSAGDKLQLTIEYKGTLREDRGGFYRSSYKVGKKDM